MPHAEYPSASACVCQSWSDAIIDYFGVDNVIGTIGGPLVRSTAAFSSIIEPLSTPNESLTYFYSSFSQINQRCGDSRIEGGMHFSQSVPAGRQLCNSIGQDVSQFVQTISNGHLPDYVVDFNDRTVTERNCYPNSDQSSSSSSSRSSSSSSRSRSRSRSSSRSSSGR